MTRNMLTFAMLLVLFGSVFAGTTVSVGETVPVGGTVSNTTTTTESPSELDEPEETDTGSPFGGMVITNDEGDSVQVGAEEGSLEVVETAPSQNMEQLQEQEGQLVQAQVQSNAGEVVQAQIMEQGQEKILVSNGVSASTNDELVVQSQNVYLEKNGNRYHVVMLPYELQYAGNGDAAVQEIKLEVYEENPAYRFTVREKRNLLWVLPVDSETEYVVDAQSGNVLQENAPWWAFIAPQNHNFKEQLESAGQNQP